MNASISLLQWENNKGGTIYNLLVHKTMKKEISGSDPWSFTYVK